MYRTIGIVVSPAFGVVMAAILLYFHGFIKNQRLFFILLASIIIVIVPLSYLSMMFEYEITDFISANLPLLGSYAWLPTVLLPALALLGAFLAAYLACKRKLSKGDVFTIMDIFAVAGLASYSISKIGCALNYCCYGNVEIELFSVVKLQYLELAFLGIIAIGVAFLIKRKPGLPFAILIAVLPLYWYLRSFFRMHLQSFHEFYALEILAVAIPLAVLYFVLVRWLLRKV